MKVANPNDDLRIKPGNADAVTLVSLGKPHEAEMWHEADGDGQGGV